MVAHPVFYGDPPKPLWILDGGVYKQAWTSDDPCDCCSTLCVCFNYKPNWPDSYQGCVNWIVINVTKTEDLTDYSFEDDGYFHRCKWSATVSFDPPPGVTVINWEWQISNNFDYINDSDLTSETVEFTDLWFIQCNVITVWVWYTRAPSEESGGCTGEPTGTCFALNTACFVCCDCQNCVDDIDPWTFTTCEVCIYYPFVWPETIGVSISGGDCAVSGTLTLVPNSSGNYIYSLDEDGSITTITAGFGPCFGWVQASRTFADGSLDWVGQYEAYFQRCCDGVGTELTGFCWIYSAGVGFGEPQEGIATVTCDGSISDPPPPPPPVGDNCTSLTDCETFPDAVLSITGFTNFFHEEALGDKTTFWTLSNLNRSYILSHAQPIPVGVCAGDLGLLVWYIPLGTQGDYDDPGIMIRYDLYTTGPEFREELWVFGIGVIFECTGTTVKILNVLFAIHEFFWTDWPDNSTISGGSVNCIYPDNRVSSQGANVYVCAAGQMYSGFIFEDDIGGFATFQPVTFIATATIGATP